MSPSISVIIPVYHEEDSINILLDHLKAITDDVSLEYIVVDGGDGGTIQRIREKDIILLVSEKGRSRQMNAGARAARGDILLFLHADTFLPDGAFRTIVRVMRNEKLSGGSFELGFANTRTIFRLIAFLSSIKRRITRVPYGDQAIFIRRGYFHMIGGYADIPLMEDVELMKRIKRKHGRIVILRSRVRTSERKWLRDGIWYTILRNWSIQVMYMLGVSPHRLMKYYYPSGV